MQLPSSVSTRLEYQHKSLLDIIEGLSDEQIRRHVEPGKWSIFENVVHLQTYQHTMIGRIRQILVGENPSFDRYTAETDPLFLENCSKPSAEIMQDLRSTRKDMVSGIVAFNEEELKKTGFHPLYGKMTLVEWLNFFLLHEAHHLFMILKLAAKLKKETA